MRQRKPLCLVALLVISGCGASPMTPSAGVAGHTSLGIQNPARPIDGRCDVTFAAPVPVGPSQLQFTIDGTCQLEHLGRTAVHIVQVATFNPDGTSDAVADVRYTAANGDELWGSGVVHSLAPTPEGILRFSGTGTFDGGTGRFVHATGACSI